MININIHGIIAIGDLLDLCSDKKFKRKIKRQEFLELDKRIQGDARILSFEELQAAYQNLVDELSQSQSLVDITGKSALDVRKVKVRGYEVVHGVNPSPGNLPEIPYDLKVYQNPRMLLDLSLTANPLEYLGCSKLEVLMASPETRLITESARILQKAAQIPFRLARTTSVQIDESNLRDHNSVRELVLTYKFVFEKTEVYKRLRGKALLEKQGQVMFEDIKWKK